MGDSEELIERARRLLDNATPGPWEAWDDAPGSTGEWIVGKDRVYFGGSKRPGVYKRVAHELPESDAEFIAAAPELVSGLLAEVERLRGELAARSDADLASVEDHVLYEELLRRDAMRVDYELGAAKDPDSEDWIAAEVHPGVVFCALVARTEAAHRDTEQPSMPKGNELSWSDIQRSAAHRSGAVGSGEQS